MPKYAVTVGTRSYEVDAPDPNTAWAWAHQYARENPPPAPKSGLLASALGATERAISSGRTGIESLFTDPNKAAAAGAERARALGEEYESSTDLQRVLDAYKQRGVIAAGKEAISQFPYALAEFAPRAVATLGTGKAGAMAGAAAAPLLGPLAPAGPLIGGALGAFVPSATEFFGSFQERQAEEQKKAGKPISIDQQAAALAALPAAGMDVVATLVPLGRTVVGKILGPGAEKILAKGGSKLADEALWKTLSKGTALSIGTEVPTEVAQQVLERRQAGLSLTSDDAMAEYAQAAYGAALLGPVGAAGRAVDRSAARGERAKQEAVKAADLRRIEDARLALEQKQTAERKYAEETGAPLLAGALPEGDEAVITGPQVPRPPEQPEDRQAETASLGRQFSLLRQEAQSVKEQIQTAAQAGDSDTVNKLMVRGQQLQAALKTAQEQAKELGVDLTMLDPQSFAERVAALQRQEKQLVKELAAAGDKYDEKKLAQTAEKLSAVRAELAQRAPVESPEQPGLFGDENLTRVALQEQERRVAQEQAAAAQKEREDEAARAVGTPLPPVSREAQGQREISEIQADIATQPDDIRTLRTLGVPQEERAAFEEAVDRGEITPLVRRYLNVLDVDTVDAEIKRLNAKPRPQEAELYNAEGRFTKAGLQVLVDDVRLAQLRKLRENMQVPKDEVLAERMVEAAGAPAREQQRKLVVAATPDLTDEQRTERINELITEQDSALLELRKQIDVAQENPRITKGTSLIAKSDRNLAYQRMEAARDRYLRALVQQMAEESAAAGKGGVSEADLMRTLPAKSVLDEMIQRSLALPRAAVVDPLGVETKPRLQSQLANRPRQAKRFLREARQIQDQMRDNYLALQRGTVRKTLPNGQVVETRMSDATRQKLVALDNRLAKRLNDLREMFRGDPEFTRSVRMVEGRATTDPRPLTQRPFRRPAAAVDALLEQLETERARLTMQRGDITALQAEAKRIENTLRQMDDESTRSVMRVGQQEGVKAETLAQRRQELQGRLALIDAVLDADTRNKEKPALVDQPSLFPGNEALIRNRARGAERVSVNREALRTLDRVLDAAEGKRTGLTDADTRMLRDARDIIEGQTESREGSTLAQQVVAEFGGLAPDVLAQRLQRAPLVTGGLRKGPFGRPASKRVAIVGAGANLQSSLRAIGDLVAASRTAARDDTAQGALFPAEQAKVVTQRATPQSFVRYVRIMAARLGREKDRTRAALQKAAILFDSAAKEKANRTARIEAIRAASRRVATSKAQAAFNDLNAKTFTALNENQQELLALNAEQNAAVALPKLQEQLASLRKLRDAYVSLSGQKPRLEALLEQGTIPGETATEEELDAMLARISDSIAGTEASAQAALGAAAEPALPQGLVAELDRRIAQADKELQSLSNVDMTTWSRRYADAIKARDAIGAAHTQAVKQLSADTKKLYEASSSTKVLAKRAARLDDALSRVEAETKSNQARKEEQQRMERLAALPGLRITNEPVQGRGGRKGEEDYVQPVARKEEELGKPRPRTRPEPLLSTPERVVYISYDVLNSAGKPEKRTLEVPVVAKVYLSGARAGQVRTRPDGSDWYTPRLQLPAPLLRLADKQIRAGEIKEAGSVEGAMPARRVILAKQADIAAIKKATRQLPGVAGETGVKRAPPLNDLRSRTLPSQRAASKVRIVPLSEYKASFRIGDAAGGVDLALARERAEDVRKKLPKDVTFTYYESAADLPAALRDEMKARGVTDAQVRGGVTPDGEVFIVGGTHADMVDMERTIAHELRGHYGFEGFVGKAGMDRLLDSAQKGDGLFALADKLGVGEQARAAALGVKMAGGDERAQQMQALKEVIAYTEEATVNQSFLDRAGRFLKELVGSVRAALKKAGLVDASKLSTSDLFYLMRQARENFEAGLPLAKMDADGNVSFRLLPERKAKPAAGYEQLASDTDRIVGSNQSVVEQARKVGFGGAALVARQNAIDMRASVEEVMRRGTKAAAIDDQTAMNVMYAVRMADHHSNIVSATVMNGAPALERSAKGEVLVKMREGANLAGMFKVLNKEVGKLGDAAFVNKAFSAYLAAERAVGKVGVEKLGVADPATLKRVLEQGRKNATFQEARRIYKQYNQNLLKFVAATGALSEQRVAEMLKGDYIPYYRVENGAIEVDTGNGYIRVGDIKNLPHLHELKGDDTKILDVFTTSLQNTSLLVDMAMKNLANRNVAFAFKELGITKSIREGTPPKGADAISFKLDGKDRYALIEPELKNELFGDISSRTLAQAMEGIAVQLTMADRVMGSVARLLRFGVTRDPRYAIRQLVRESVSMSVQSGANFVPIISALKQLPSVLRNQNVTERGLVEKGIVGGRVFQGLPEDMQRIALQITAGGQGKLGALLAGLDTVAIKADTLTRVNMYDSFIKQGMSEQEATMAVMDAANFTKRGASPWTYRLNNAIPFFQAQIVGMDAFYRALRGKATGEEKARIQRKMIVRGAMIAGMMLLYTNAMEDDEAYENATPQQRVMNWFVRVPGLDQALRIPIPFEVGLVFKALPEVLFNAMAKDAKAEQVNDALLEIGKQFVPGLSSYFLPQAIKPVFEVLFNTTTSMGVPVVSRRLQGLDPELQYDERTPEIVKQVGAALGVSPKVLEHFVQSYTGPLGLLVAQIPDMLLADASAPGPDKRLSDMKLIGPFFQPNDGSGLLQLAFQQAEEHQSAMNTYKRLIMTGKDKEAEQFLSKYSTQIALTSASGKLRQIVGKINTAEVLIKADPKLSSQEKRQQLDELRQIELLLSRQVTDLRRETARQ